jgi:hypothetical protein
VIRYTWVALAVLLLFSPVYAQEQQPEPKFSAAQLGTRTVMMLPSNWTASATQGEIELTPSSPAQSVVASSWWNATVEPGGKVMLKLAKNVDKRSEFIIQTNSANVTYTYRMLVNNTTYLGKITPETGDEESRYVRWTDGKEKAATAFIPENWSADMQIIRPYKSMTGFVFFARGSEHTLVYVFQPFMPLHLLPDNSLCQSAQLCSGMVSADKVREMSFGNAPVAISDVKTPDQYFASEVMPILRKNLRSYSVESALSTYALTVGDYNSTDISLTPVYDIKYSFDSEGKKIDGRAMVFTRNYTSGNVGVWDGFIVGVESLDKNFDATFQQAAVTLLTLRFNEKWLDAEKNILLGNANASHELENISALMANNTLGDFNVVVPTAAHKMVRTYNNTMIAGFTDTATKQELHLPLFPDSQHWYLNNDELIGRKVGRNPMNASTLQVLFS